MLGETNDVLRLNARKGAWDDDARLKWSVTQ